VGTQARLVTAEAPTATFQRLDGLLTEAPAEQNIDVVEVVEEFREESVAVLGDGLQNPVKHALSTPSGLSAVFNRNGGMPPMMTALLSPWSRTSQITREISTPPHRETTRDKFFNLR
jgi:hypothetical protein